MLRAERLSLDIKKSFPRNFRDLRLYKFSELLNKACGLWSRKMVIFRGVLPHEFLVTNRNFSICLKTVLIGKIDGFNVLRRSNYH